MIEYLDAARGEKLVELIEATGLTVREVLRRKGTPYDDLGNSTMRNGPTTN